MTGKLKLLTPWVLLLMVLGGFQTLPGEQLTKDEVIRKNIEATGGIQKIKALGGISYEIALPPPFKDVNKVLLKDGKLIKVLTGSLPLVEKIVLFDGKEFKTKGFGVKPTLREIDKCELKCFAALAGGGFSLANLKDKLTLKGVKRYGPEKNYVMESQVQGHQLRIFVDAKSFLLRRMEIQNQADKIDQYKMIYEFGEPKEVAGLQIPLSFFKTDVGAGAGNSPEIDATLRNFKTGIKFGKDFTSNMDLNFGNTSVKKYKIGGNLISFVYFEQAKQSAIYTNLTTETLKKSQFKTGNEIVVEMGGKKYPCFFTTNQNEMKPEMLKPGLSVLTMSNRVPYAIILMVGEQFKPLEKQLKQLTHITIRRK